MALKYIDGFEQYATGNGIAHIVGKSSSIPYYAWNGYDGGSTSFSVGTTYFRSAQTNSSSLEIGGYGSLFMNFPADETVILGFGVRTSGNLKDAWTILHFNNVPTYANTSAGLHIQVMGDGSIRMYNEATNTTLDRSAPGVVGALIWQYFEIKISFGASAAYEVRINGDTVISATGRNTFCGLTSVYGLNLATLASAGSSTYFDDFYICDTSGTVNNDFLGPISVYTLFPNADGSSTNFTPQGAASNFAAVNSRLPSTATYVQSGTTG